MRKKTTLSLLLLGIFALNSFAEESKSESNEQKVNYMPEIHGTVRAKFEYQPDMGASRFQVRNARFSLNGKVAPIVSYKAEIDFSDEGSIKMLDAYGRITPISNFNFTIGQMRVPFTIDAHRGPHQQYFANRSFIAKQVGNVRDVGATVGYTVTGNCPLTLEAGIFNGSGLTNQKNFWTKQVNFSVKAQINLPQGFNVTLSTQKVKPESTTIMMYDAGAFFHAKGWHIEAEYLFKHYSNNAFDNVHAVDAFISYDLKLRSKLLKKISFLGRYDYMGDHSDGKGYDADGNELEGGNLIINDYKRHRATGGVTLSLTKPFTSDIRINYEKYFYDSDATIKTSEGDKLVIEYMIRF